MFPETHCSKKSFLDVSLRYKSFFDGQCKFSLYNSLLPGLYEDLAVTCLARACTSDYASLSLVNRRFNSLIKSGILCDLRRTMKILEQFVYLVCDPRGWVAFDPIRKRWMQLPKIPCDECFNYADKESLAVRSELMVFGREFADFAIWKYSLIHRNWVKCDKMNFPRCLFASSTFGSIAVVAGGSNKGGNVLRSAEIYDSSIGKWEMLPNMHVSRRLCSGFFMDEKFYVIGGISGRVTLTCGEELDLKTRKWRRIKHMYPVSNGIAQAPPLVAVVNNQLYAVEHLKNMVMRYNKENNDWSALGRLPKMADLSNGWGFAFKAFGEALLVVGGQRSPEGEVLVLNSWSPSSASNNAALDWKVVGLKEHAGVFVYNCAVMNF